MSDSAICSVQPGSAAGFEMFSSTDVDNIDAWQFIERMDPQASTSMLESVNINMSSALTVDRLLGLLGEQALKGYERTLAATNDSPKDPELYGRYVGAQEAVAEFNRIEREIQEKVREGVSPETASEVVDLLRDAAYEAQLAGRLGEKAKTAQKADQNADASPPVAEVKSASTTPKAFQFTPEQRREKFEQLQTLLPGGLLVKEFQGGLGVLRGTPLGAWLAESLQVVRSGLIP